MDMPSSDTKHSQQAVNAKNCGNLAIPQKNLAIPRHQAVLGTFLWSVGSFQDVGASAETPDYNAPASSFLSAYLERVQASLN